MRTYMRIGNLALLVVAALLVCSAAWADPPARVGRLNLLQGSGAFMAADTDEWVSATVNYPLTAGDCLWTEASSRAEAHVGSTAIRMGSGTELGFLELDEAQVRIRLAHGLLSVRLRELEPGESFAVDTPAMSLSLLAPGSYRFEITGDADARAIVHQGQLEAVVAGLAYPVRADQAVQVAGSGPVSLRMGRAPALDAWDRWGLERDEGEDHLASVQYVPRAMVGCEDLDRYGTWSVTVELGPVWTPSSLPAGWEPYRFGRWAWAQPWGWTWIDDLPWGFAPFHYGRWALAHGRWVWVPGPRVHQPVYRPMIVAPGIQVRPAHREPGQVFIQRPQSVVQQATPPREYRPAASLSVLGAIAQLARQWQPGRGPSPKAGGSREPLVQQSRKPEAQQAREPRVQKGREPKAQQKWQKVRRKKILANGQFVWVEELVPVEQ